MPLDYYFINIWIMGKCDTLDATYFTNVRVQQHK